jgi:hypothetical protein
MAHADILCRHVLLYPKKIIDIFVILYYVGTLAALSLRDDTCGNRLTANASGYLTFNPHFPYTSSFLNKV